MRPQDPSRRRFCTLAAAALGMAAGLGIRRPSLARDTIPGDYPLSAAGQTTPMPEEWRRRPVRRPVSPRADLALAIDQRLFPALRPLALDYAARHGLTVALREGACDIASDALARKTADITGMCRPPDPPDRLPGLRYHTLGIAALGLIVHPSNRLNEVSLAAARRLLGGGTGGIGGPAWGRNRPHCAGLSGRRLPPPDKSARLSLDMIEIPAIADMIAEVARNPQGIGCETLWHIARHKARWP
ncbi:MAG: hypothetical protein K2Q10_08145, partial [Rhodospirillales bacterium]|nr:hypothetical protein [Rhodospirillales bacterium]